jgi:hypothetical protein
VGKERRKTCSFNNKLPQKDLHLWSTEHERKVGFQQYDRINQETLLMFLKEQGRSTSTPLSSGTKIKEFLRENKHRIKQYFPNASPS